MIPADGPDRVGGRVGVALEAARAGDLGELVAADDRPSFCPAVPGRERAGGNVGPGLGLLTMLAVIRVHEQALTRVEALAVVTGQARAAERLLELLVPE